MNKWITFITCALMAFVSTGLMSQAIIWGGPDDPNSTFAGGLNGWTAVGVSCSDNANGQAVAAANAKWEYKANASPSGGAYAGSEPILSPTAANGAALFNSDRLDNNGVQGAFLTGSCPSPHKAYLVSPVIDLTGENSVILTFHQYYRNYQARTTVEVSGNGGQTWTEFVFNQEIELNASTPRDSKKSIDISAVAANNAEVQIRFVFDGDYYFWIIDDVVLISSLPENSLGMDRHFYPVSNISIPQGLAAGETYSFSARISNDGGNTVTNAFLKVQIVAATGGAIMWEDSIALEPLPSGTSGLVVQFPEDVTYSPADLAVGQYFIRYTIYQPGIVDNFPTDNVRQSTFNITANNDVWQSGVLRQYTRPCFDASCDLLAPWAWGSFFFVPEETVEDFRISDVVVSVAGENAAADLNGKEISFFMLEILNDDFFGDSTTPEDGSNTYVGAGFKSVSASDNRQEIPIELVDLDDEPFILEKGAFYFAFLSMPEGLIMGYDNQYLNYPLSLSNDNVIFTSRLFFDGVFQSTFRDAMPFIKFNMLTTTVDNTPLPDYALTLFPNPAGNYTTMDVKLDQASNITITLADINGKVINFQNFQSVQNMQHTIDTSMLPNGAYVVRVATEMGTSTRKLVIAK